MSPTAPGDDDRRMSSTTPGTPPPAASPPPPADRPAPEGGFFNTLRRAGVQRSDDRWVGGVCSGVAERLGIDPLIVRGLLVVAFLLSGVGAVAYGLAWAFLPERRDARIHAEELVAGRFDIAVLGAAALVVTGMGRGDNGWWDAGPRWAHGLFGVLSGLLWLMFVVGVAIAVLVVVSRNRTPRVPPPWGSAPPRPPYGTPQGPTPPSGAPTASDTPAGPTGPAAPTTPGASTPYPSAPYPSTPYPSTSYPSTPHPSAPYPSASYPSTPYASAHAGPPSSPSGPAGPADPTGPTGAATRGAPTVPPQPPARTKPRRRGPGATSLGIVVALGLLTFAGLLAAHRTGAFDGPVLLTTLGVTAALAGTGIVVAGLRGRSSGSLGFIAIVALLMALPVGAVEHRDWTWDEAGIRNADTPVLVTTRSAAADGLRFGVGDAVLDLSDVPMTDDVLVVPVSVGAGKVRVVVPADAAVEATARIGFGSVSWEVDGTHESASGVGLGGTTFRDEATRAGAAQLSLELSVGAGEVTITREDS